MSLSTRDQVASRRQNRVYGANESPGVMLSGVSLISNNTAISSNSNGSASTVTQDSYLKSKQPSEKKKRRTRVRSDVSEEKVEKPVSDTPIVAQHAEVFGFLVEAAERDNVQPEMEMTNSQSLLQPKQEAQSNSDASDVEGYYRTQLTDAGISMQNSLGDINTDLSVKHPLPTLVEEASDFTHYAPSVVDSYYQHEPPQVWAPFGGPAYVPEPMPLSPASIRTYPYPQEYAYRGTPDPPSTREPSVTCLDSAPLVFRNKSGKKIQPPFMFRSFAKLNEKVLLQMQSNITDLEYELAVLDATTVSAETGTRHKRSGHTNVFQQRADLYQELHKSLEQYHEALDSFRQISQLTSPCGTPDTIAFKSWLRHQVLPSSRVASLVGDGSDMVRFGSQSKESSDQTLQVIAYIVFANILLPLLLFKLASGVLSRLIILSITTIVATLIMERHRTNAKNDLGDLHWHCIIGSASVSLFAAILF